ncbi:MAG: TIR domain-containing protein [Oscillospiraceae bacterium]|nr:TIR domain-containing protein [Oscillospiraceae bacterium]
MSFPRSDEKFSALLKERAKACDPEFQWRVGHCYDFGTGGIEKNHAEAVKWYKLAAEQGHAGAQCNLGYSFGSGEGIKKDLKEAVKWYDLSAKQGHARAQNNLAVTYENGEGVTQDFNEALRLFKLSAEQGFWLASSNLGLLYFNGNGVEQNFAEAKKYYEKALVDADSPYDPATEADKENIKEKIVEVNSKLEEIERKAKAARKAERTEVFISYSRKDTAFKEELEPHLKMLENIANITWWDDSKIKPGEDWEEKITEALSKAKVAVLLASVNFFASDYIWRKELPAILEAADQHGATILWVPVRTCLFDETGITRFQSVVTDLKNSLDKRDSSERDDVYTDLVRRIRGLFKA